MRLPKLFTCFVLLWLASGHGYAQRSTIIEMGIGAGAGVYQGDVSPHPLGNFSNVRPGFQAFVHALFHQAFSVRGGYSFISLKDDESAYRYDYHTERNFAFETTINELSVQVVVNPLRNNLSVSAFRLQPYLFAGVGIGFLQVKRDWSRFNHSFAGWQSWVRQGLSQDSLTKMPTSIATFPLGLGLRYAVGENVSLYAEVDHRITRNGYIDGFSMAANPRRDDAFTTLNLGVIFRLSGYRNGGSVYGCPANVW